MFDVREAPYMLKNSTEVYQVQVVQVLVLVLVLSVNGCTIDNRDILYRYCTVLGTV